MTTIKLDNPKKLLSASVILGIWADLFLCLIIYTKITQYSYFKSVFSNALVAQGIDLSMIGEEMIQEYFHLMANTTLTLLTLFIVAHLFLYGMLLKKKAFAERYMLLYFATAFLGFIALTLTSVVDIGPIFFSSALETALYGIAFVLLRKTRPDQSKETPAKNESR